MTKQAKLRSLLWLSIAVAALMFLSTGLSELEFLPARPFPLGLFGLAPSAGWPAESPPELPAFPFGFWGAAVLLMAAALLTLWIITFILRPQARKRMLTRLIAYLFWFLLIVGLTNLCRQLGFIGQLQLNPAQPELSELAAPIEAVPVPPGFISNPPPWLIGTVTLLLVTLPLAAAWFLWQRRPRGQASSLQLLAQEAQQAIEALQTGSDLKDTVMRSYQQMSRVLSEQRGIQRPKAMTPREFENHLSQIGLRSEHIRRLTRLFEGVRYGAMPPGEREEQEAIACLSAIVEAYGRPS